MWFQWFSWIGLIFFTIVFIVQFIYNMAGSDKLCLFHELHTADLIDNCTYKKDVQGIGNYTPNGVDRTSR